MIGKQKCKILKEIRQKIADENNIPYVTRECSHTGECSGTCPFCESEVRYLDRELKKRASLGKGIKIAAVCAGVALTVSGCSVIDATIERVTKPTAEPEIIELSGEVAWPEYQEPEQEPLPTVPAETDIAQFDLTGYVPPLDYD